jgi:phospholipid/cholesterol/gamma-HCH transport system substrate-binding protein
MELEFSNKEKMVGLFIIGVIFLLVTSLVVIGRGKDWFEKYVVYYTTFNESYNLQENAAVKLYRTDIGKVRKITLVGNEVKVKLAISEKYASRIRTDSQATVESPTFIGSEYISIKPGSPNAPLIHQHGNIPSMAPRTLSDVLDEFQVEKTAKMVVKAIQDLSEVAHIMRDPQGPFFTALENTSKLMVHFEKIIGDIQAGKGTVGGLLKSSVLLDAVTDDLARIREILGNVDEASAKTPGMMDQMQDNLSAMHDIEGEVLEGIAVFKKVLKDMEDGAGNLKIIIENMKKGSQDIPEIIQSTREGIVEIREGVKDAHGVFKSLRKNLLIRSNLPPEPDVKNIDAGLRQ